jgi:hypothetical protein
VLDPEAKEHTVIMRVMPSIPIRTATNIASPICFCIALRSPVAAALATSGVTSDGRKLMVQNADEKTRSAAPCAASATVSPIRPTQNTSAAPTCETVRRRRQLAPFRRHFEGVLLGRQGAVSSAHQWNEQKVQHRWNPQLEDERVQLGQLWLGWKQLARFAAGILSPCTPPPSGTRRCCEANGDVELVNALGCDSGRRASTCELPGRV